MRFFTSRRNARITLISLSVLLPILGLLILVSAYIGLIDILSIRALSNSLLVQTGAIIIGWIAMFIVSKVNYNLYKRYAEILIFLSLAIMALLLLGLGDDRNNATRWIAVGFATFQPAELLKLTSVIFYAYFFSLLEKKSYNNTLLYKGAAIFIAIALLLLLQPDTGTFLAISGAIFFMYLCSSVTKRFLPWIFMVGVAVFSTVAISFDYIANRFIIWYKVWFDKLTVEDTIGAAFHILKNIETLSYGGFFGVGFGQSVQKFFGNLPEISTDSIYALIGEEFGLIGTVGILLLFLLLIYSCTLIASRAKNRFGMLLGVGIGSLIALQVFTHIFVVIGAPSTGVPLVFFSKGGSIILFTLISLGIVLSIENMRNKGDIASNI